MIHIIYISSATKDMNEKDLLELLEESRRNNKKYNVTGMLLYKNGAFLQVLEGDEKYLDEIYKTILQDERNTGHYLIERKEITQRQFPDWSMGFEDLTHHGIDELEGYSDIFKKKKSPHEIAKFRDMVVDLLLRF